MALKADSIREIVERNTHNVIKYVTGATDWDQVAAELNDEVLRQLAEVEYDLKQGPKPIVILPHDGPETL